MVPSFHLVKLRTLHEPTGVEASDWSKQRARGKRKMAASFLYRGGEAVRETDSTERRKMLCDVGLTVLWKSQKVNQV